MNVFDLFARIILDTDDYDRNLNEAGEKAHAFGDALKKGLGTAAKVSAAAITAASAAAGVLVKQSLDGYAEFEQLVGGVKTLFGTEAESVEEYAASVGKSVSEVQGEYDKLVRSQNTVMDNAANAFRTAGLSANQYMETVTSFSASLLQGLGGDTEEAARIADLAITDMADNANKMGTAMDSIQNAYQGFAKQNYTMLDNLKLGYGGTQAEMARLINDSGVLGGTMKVTAETVNQVSFDKMIEAIHVVQTEMGITGTTALEASTTIQGSVASAKSAWANLVAGIADENANLDQLISNFVESVGTAGGNIIPRMEQILSGMGSAIQKLAPIITEQVPKVITAVLPSMVSAGAQLLVGLITGIIGALPSLAAAIPEIANALILSLSENAPVIAEAGIQLLNMLISGVQEGIPQLQAIAGEMFSNLIGFLQENLPEMIAVGLSALLSFSDGFRENVGSLVDAAIELIMTLADGVIEVLPEFIATVPEIISNFANAINDNAPKLLLAAAELIAKLVQGIIESIPVLIANAPKIALAIFDVITAFNWISLGQKIVTGIINGVKSLFGSVTTTAQTLVQNWRTVISDLPGYFKAIGQDMIQGLINGVKSMAGKAVENVKSIGTSVVSGLKSILGIHSPSTVFAGIGENMALGLEEGWGNKISNVKNRITSGMDFGTTSVDFASSAVGQSSAAIINSVSGNERNVPIIPLTIDLLTGDSRAFAEWVLPDLIAVADARGTPIAGQQYA